MLYPLFFEPIYKNIIWGGRTLEKVFNRVLPPGDIAESWEVCCHKNDISVVKNGHFKGKTLHELINSYGSELLGEKCSEMDRFPLLIKIIDANDKLSVQVHPGDDYALKTNGDLGKTEMWYILDAKDGAQLIYGTIPGTTKNAFMTSIENGTLEKYLNYVSVKKGDVIFIPSGTIHAIMDGILIAEIQQNSDTTFRVYDWNRTLPSGLSRELHIEQALDVINFDYEGSVTTSTTATNECNGLMKHKLIDCEFFKVDKIVLSDSLGGYEDNTDGTSFLIYTSIEGNGSLIHNDVIYDITNGCSFMIPAFMGDFKIIGNVTLLKSYI